MVINIYKIESIHVLFVYVCVLLAALAFSLGLGSVTRQQPNNELMRSFGGSVVRQRPVSNNGVLFSLGSVAAGTSFY
jgi:hypothetical protein